MSSRLSSRSATLSEVGAPTQDYCTCADKCSRGQHVGVERSTRYTLISLSVHIIGAQSMCKGSVLGRFLGGLIKCQPSLGLPCASPRLSRKGSRSFFCAAFLRHPSARTLLHCRSITGTADRCGCVARLRFRMVAQAVLVAVLIIWSSYPLKCSC